MIIIFTYFVILFISNTSIYSLQFVHRPPWWSVSPCCERFGPRNFYHFGSFPRCGVFFHLPSEAERGNVQNPTELEEVNDGSVFARKPSKNDPTNPKNSGFSMTLWSLYICLYCIISVQNGQYGRWITKICKFTTEWVSATASNLKHGTMMCVHRSSHSDLGEWRMSSIYCIHKSSGFCSASWSRTISIQWLFLLHWYHHFLIENDSWCEVHDGIFLLFYIDFCVCVYVCE